jgi:DNA helicase II / ATP-dependent DNA helicase PcrA
MAATAPGRLDERAVAGVDTAADKIEYSMGVVALAVKFPLVTLRVSYQCSVISLRIDRCFCYLHAVLQCKSRCTSQPYEASMSPRMLPPQFCDPRERREAERLVFQELSAQLDDGWTVIHDMAWIGSSRRTRTSYLQADFVLCHPDYGVIVLEVKGGGISRHATRWYQTVRGGNRKEMKIAPQEQAKIASFAVRDKLLDVTGRRWPSFTIVSAVCFPDSWVGDTMFDATIDREIVIDQRDIRSLPEAFVRIREYWRQRGELFRFQRRLDEEWIETVRETFARDFVLQAMLGPLVELEKRKVKELSEEQGSVFFAVRHLNRIAVPGCAGSGKTLLAQVLARRFAQEGKQVLLCCYNLLLREELERSLQNVLDSVCVQNADELFRNMSDAAGVPYNEISDAATKLVPAITHAKIVRWPTYDVVIVDEGQDIDESWWPVFEGCLNSLTESRLYIFYDDNQRIYRRKPALPENMGEMPLTINYRSTRAIHEEVIPYYEGHNGVLPLPRGEIGDNPSFIPYNAENPNAQWQELRAQLKRLIDSGLPPEEIVILTPRGVDDTALRQLETQFQLLSHASMPGKVQWDTVYRFKGLERTAVIIVELDETTAGREHINELLYVAYSRACHRLYVLYNSNLPEKDIRARLRGLRAPSEKMLAELNDEQRAAVTAPVGRTIVWAGAGSGKTRVLTQRVVYLIEALGVAPEHIVAVTFTKKAAREMRARIRQQLPRAVVDKLTIKTFHSWCYDLLRDEIRRLPGRQFAGRQVGFEVLHNRDADRYCTAAATAPLTADKLRGFVARKKNDGLWPADLDTGESELGQLWVDAYFAYEELLREHNRVDFDDLLLLTARLLEQHPEACSRRHRKHLALLIDEFQDTNPVQMTIVQAIHNGPPGGLDEDGYQRSLFVVGDPQQSIYGFRGADYRLFDRIREDYPDAKDYQLVLNYRSTRQIVNAALTIARPEYTGVEQLPLEAVKPEDGPEIDILYSDALEEEAFEISSRIVEAMRSGMPPKQIAVLMRTVRGVSYATWTLLELERIFKRMRIPYVLVGLNSFYQNPVVETLIAVLRAVDDPEDDEHLRAVFTKLAHQVDDKTVDALIAARKERGYECLWTMVARTTATGAMHPYHSVVSQYELGVAGIGDIRYKSIAEVVRWVITFREKLHEVSDFGQLISAIRVVTELDKRLGEFKKSEDYEALFAVFAEHLMESAERGMTLKTVLDEVTLDDDVTTEDENEPQDGGRVQVMSIHKSKGLEFEMVFVPGLEDGVLPSRRAEGHENLMEEGRICYVALTRAKTRLTIAYLPNRGGRREPFEPSRYVVALRNELARPLCRPRLRIDRIPVHISGKARIQRMRRRGGGPSELVQIDFEADAAHFEQQPARVVIDATHELLEPRDLDELETLLSYLPGSYPVTILLDDNESGLTQFDTGQRICADPALLALLRRVTGMSVQIEALVHVHSS